MIRMVPVSSDYAGSRIRVLGGPRRDDLEDVDGGLVDGAGDGAAGVHDVAHHPHHNGGRPRIQPRSRLIPAGTWQRDDPATAVAQLPAAVDLKPTYILGRTFPSGVILSRFYNRMRKGRLWLNWPQGVSAFGCCAKVPSPSFGEFSMGGHGQSKRGDEARARRGRGNTAGCTMNGAHTCSQLPACQRASSVIKEQKNNTTCPNLELSRWKTIKIDASILHS